MKKVYYLFFFWIAMSCSPSKSDKSKERGSRNLQDTIAVFSAAKAIQERGGEMIALTANTSSSYFIYKGQTMGYEYEMLQHLAEYLNVDLKIKIVHDLDSIFIKLNEGEGDVIAYSMTVTNQRKEWVDFVNELYYSPQVLIQRKPANWRRMKIHEIDKVLVRNVLELTGKDIYVRKNSSYYSRLMNLEDEIGDSLNIITVEGDITTEDLIDKVAKGEIDYTVADLELAKMFSTYNNIIDYHTAISMPQKKAWAVRKNSPVLRDTINAWLYSFKKDEDFYFIYDKYFENPRVTRRIALSQYTSLTGKISEYDSIFKQESSQIGWDWRLLASQVYQESKFDPKEQSWMGAEGLMQLLPSTAEMFGYTELYDPETNVKAGTAYLKYLEKNFQNLDSINTIKFTLASYNVGLGHVLDAMRLASYLGKDSTIWDDNVAEAILLKSKEKYHKLPICKYGYCRGTEPYHYVYEIMRRYEDYKQLID